MSVCHRDFLGPTHQRSNRMKNRPFLEKPLCEGDENRRHYRATVHNLKNLLKDYLRDLAYLAEERLQTGDEDQYNPDSWHNLRRARLNISMYEGNSYLGIIFTNE